MGKILVINLLTASLFVYKMSVLRNMSKKLIDRFYEPVGKFLWNSDTSRLDKSILTLPKDQGGLRLVDLMAKQQSLKIRWIFQTIGDPFFSEIIVRNLVPQLGHYIWQCNLAVNDVKRVVVYNPKKFWIQVLEAWCCYNFKEDIELQYTGEQIIWCNSLIKVGHQPIVWESALQAGIRAFNDLLDENREPLTYDDFCIKFGLCFTWLNYYSLISAIPTEWFQIVQNIQIITDNSQTNFDKLNSTRASKTNIVYGRLISNPYRLNSICYYRSTKLNCDLHCNTYIRNFHNAYYCTIST